MSSEWVGMAIISGMAASIAAAASAYIWWRIRKEAERAEKTAGRLEESVKRRLYRVDGQTVYVPRGECDRMHNDCRQTICQKIDAMRVEFFESRAELKGLIAQADAKREDTREEFVEQLRELAKFMGRVEEYMARRA